MEETTDKPNKRERKTKGIYVREEVYYVSFYYYDQTGVRRRFRKAIGPNKKEAEDFLGKKRAEAREGKLFDVQKDEKITFENFGKEYLERHTKIYLKSSRTDEQRLTTLNKILGKKYLFEITSKDIESFKALRLADEIKPATINRSMALLRSMFNRAKEWGRLHRANPCDGMRKLRENNERLRFLSKDEIEKLVAACEGELLAFVKFGLNTGMRRGEIVALTWRDIDIHRGQIHIRDSKSGKGRILQMNETVRSLLLSLRKQPDSELIFSSYFRKEFDAAVAKAELDDFIFHDLRHTFASHLVMSGVDLVTVSKLLGHASIQMTMRYSHLSPEHQAKAIGVLDRVFGLKSYKIDTKWAQGENPDGKVMDRFIVTYSSRRSCSFRAYSSIG
ncbi:MAG: site-specific integrase [Candidatus Omnitrophota bacterium]